MASQVLKNSVTFKVCSVVATRLLEEKFLMNDSTFILNYPHTKQTDAKSCGVLVCYYALALAKGTYISVITYVHTFSFPFSSTKPDLVCFYDDWYGSKISEKILRMHLVKF